MKHSEITDPKKRNRFSSQNVGDVFRSRPWTIAVWETKQYSIADSAGFDMFVRCKPSFLQPLFLDGDVDILSVQIKSAVKSMKSFERKYAHEDRFFNIKDKVHQLILCGMDEPDLILADIVGQLVVQAWRGGKKEIETLDYLGKNDGEAVSCYRRLKVLLGYRWYGDKLPRTFG